MKILATVAVVALWAFLAYLHAAEMIVAGLGLSAIAVVGMMLRMGVPDGE